MKIIDFGLSDSDAFFILKHPAGTTGFIAPEQFMPDAKAEPRTDIFSNKKEATMEQYLEGDSANHSGNKVRDVQLWNPY